MKARRAKGIMLVELMAGTLVFAIAVAGYFGIQARKQAHILAAKQLSLAQQGCANKLEELRALSPDAAGRMDGRRFGIKGLEGRLGAAGEIHTTEYENLWEVSVAATWSSGGRERCYELWTFLPKGG